MKTIVITGANTGIGQACALSLAEPATHLVLACRSRAKTEPVLEKVRAKGATASFLELDLADLAQCKSAAAQFIKEHGALDILINNAGLAGQFGITKDGYELAFGVNHLGHFAFTLGLLPLLEQSHGRIVNVSSGSHYKAKSLSFEHVREKTRTRTGLPEYEMSKLCNVLFTAELRRRYMTISSISVHPGRIASDIWRGVPQPFRTVLPALLFMSTVEVGASAVVQVARIPINAETPIYYHMLHAKEANPLALSEDLATELWDYSEKALGQISSAKAA